MAKFDSEIVLIRVPNFLLYDEKLQIPLGILYIASYIRKHSEKVRVCDLAGVPPDEWAGKIPSGYKFYGISMTTADVPVANAVGRLIKKLYPDSVLICGGAHPSALPTQVIEEGIFDIACIGEGEQTVLELVRGKPQNEINGICYNDDGIIKTNSVRDYWKNLDDLPFPAWDLIPDIISHHLVEEGAPATCITCSRGCPYNCSFCATSDVFRRTYRLRSAKNVLREIKLLKNEYGVKEVRLVDELTLLDRKHFADVCESLARLGMRWRTHSRADLICKNKDLLKVAKDSGITELAVGVENPDDGILNLVNKRITSAQCEESIGAIKDAGIQSKAYFIVGLPGESWATVNNMISWIRRVKPDRTTLSTFVPFPCCDIWLNPEKYNFKLIYPNDWHLAWILGLENSQEPFMGETEFMNNKDLIKARQMLFDFMVSEGYKSPPPEGFEYNLATYRKAIENGLSE